MLAPVSPRLRARLATPAVVAVTVALVVLARLSYLTTPLRSDEAGYLLVARAWHLGGPNLYGHYWVDRPPVLFALYKLAAAIPWHFGIRLVALGAVVVFVLAGAWAGHLAGGGRGARWAVVVAGALAVTPALWAYEADGELLAIPLVMLGMALTLEAVGRSGWRAFGCALGAGFAAACAVMVKQNFADAFVFAAVLVLAGLVQRRLSAARAGTVLAGGVLGAAVVLLGVAEYAVAAGVGVGELWHDLYGFRGAAFDVIVSSSMASRLPRVAELVALAAIAGLVPVILALVGRAIGRRGVGTPVAWAVAATLLFGLAGITLGGSYWPHYLLQLAPVLVVAAGAWASRSVWVAGASGFTVVSAVVLVSLLAGWAVAPYTSSADDRQADRVGRWVRRSGEPHDTATVLYGHATIQLASGMPSPYEHLWSLPSRTLDPTQRQLRALLRGPDAPTWVVVWADSDTWTGQGRPRLRRVLMGNYLEVQVVCGHEVWLHEGQVRRLAPLPPRCG